MYIFTVDNLIKECDLGSIVFRRKGRVIVQHSSEKHRNFSGPIDKSYVINDSRESVTQIYQEATTHQMLEAME